MYAPSVEAIRSGKQGHWRRVVAVTSLPGFLLNFGAKNSHAELYEAWMNLPVVQRVKPHGRKGGSKHQDINSMKST